LEAVANHFACIGLWEGDMQRSFEKLAPLLDHAADDMPPAPPYRHLRWTDPSGASVAVHTRGGVVECITPWFAPPGGPTRWRVRTQAVATDPECVHCSGADCDVLDDDFALVTRASIQWLHFLPWQSALGAARELELEVVAFADEAHFFESSEAFVAAQSRWFDSDGKGAPRGPGGKPLRFADNAFVPIGMFEGGERAMSERASAMFAGRVESVERHAVDAFGSAFQQVRVRTLPGAVDVLVEPGSSEGAPEVGRIAWVQGWLVGRPTEAPPHHERVVRPIGTARRQWWARVLRKRG
jgi:hypothetical protein